MHMCTELLNIFINYLKFLIIKILEGIQAEIKSITPHDNPENWQLTEPVQGQSTGWTSLGLGEDNLEWNSKWESRNWKPA